MAALLDEIITLIAAKGEISIDDIQQVFHITKEAAYAVTNFLMKFGFLSLVGEKYLVLSETSIQLFEETVE